MKGSFIHNQINYQIEIYGESWQQGEVIKGVLHGAGYEGPLFIELKNCQIKDIRSLNLDKVKLIDRVELSQGQSEFHFQLTNDIAITDNKSSLYLFYGPGPYSHLQLAIEPLPLYKDYIKTMETFFRFKVKKIRSHQNKVEYTLSPPVSKEWAMMDGLVIKFSLDEEKKLHLSYLSKTKKIDYQAQVQTRELGLKKQLEEYHFELAPSDYLFYGRDFNQEKVRDHLSQALSTIQNKVLPA